jgi:hypothetical protein
VNGHKSRAENKTKQNKNKKTKTLNASNQFGDATFCFATLINCRIGITAEFSYVQSIMKNWKEAATNTA